MCATVATLVASGCGSGEEDGDRPVVAAFYPLAYAVGQIAGDEVEVTNLTPPGAEPHDLELTARDVESLRDAALVVYAGEGFQATVEDALEERTGPSLDVLHGLGLRLSTGHDHEEEAGSATEGHEDQELDPHVWLDPTRFATIVRRIATELGDPTGADDLVARLETLDRELRRGLAHCRRRELVTSHAAFGYLADRYGLEQIPLTGVSPESEPSPKELEELVHEVRETGATTVFFETLVSPELAETVARESGATTAVLDPIEGLSQDDLDAGADYFTVMRENLAALRKALGCT